MGYYINYVCLHLFCGFFGYFLSVSEETNRNTINRCQISKLHLELKIEFFHDILAVFQMFIFVVTSNVFVVFHVCSTAAIVNKNLVIFLSLFIRFSCEILPIFQRKFPEYALPWRGSSFPRKSTNWHQRKGHRKIFWPIWTCEKYFRQKWKIRFLRKSMK